MVPSIRPANLIRQFVAPPLPVPGIGTIIDILKLVYKAIYGEPGAKEAFTAGLIVERITRRLVGPPLGTQPPQGIGPIKPNPPPNPPPGYPPNPPTVPPPTAQPAPSPPPGFFPKLIRVGGVLYRFSLPKLAGFATYEVIMNWGKIKAAAKGFVEEAFNPTLPDTPLPPWGDLEPTGKPTDC